MTREDPPRMRPRQLLPFGLLLLLVAAAFVATRPPLRVERRVELPVRARVVDEVAGGREHWQAIDPALIAVPQSESSGVQRIEFSRLGDRRISGSAERVADEQAGGVVSFVFTVDGHPLRARAEWYPLDRERTRASVEVESTAAGMQRLAAATLGFGGELSSRLDELLAALATVTRDLQVRNRARAAAEADALRRSDDWDGRRRPLSVPPSDTPVEERALRGACAGFASACSSDADCPGAWCGAVPGLEAGFACTCVDDFGTGFAHCDERCAARNFEGHCIPPPWPILGWRCTRRDAPAEARRRRLSELLAPARAALVASCLPESGTQELVLVVNVERDALRVEHAHAGPPEEGDMVDRHVEYERRFGRPWLEDLERRRPDRRFVMDESAIRSRSTEMRRRVGCVEGVLASIALPQGLDGRHALVLGKGTGARVE